MKSDINSVIEIAKNRHYSQMELIYDGTQEFNQNPRSHVYRVGDFCIKYYIRTKIDCSCEATHLLQLEEYGFAPKMYYRDLNDNFIVMEYIDGIQLGKIKDALTESQWCEIEWIRATLKKLKIYYEKENMHCIIDKSGKIRFIDFGI